MEKLIVKNILLVLGASNGHFIQNRNFTLLLLSRITHAVTMPPSAQKQHNIPNKCCLLSYVKKWKTARRSTAKTYNQRKYLALYVTLTQTLTLTINVTILILIRRLSKFFFRKPKSTNGHSLTTRIKQQAVIMVTVSSQGKPTVNPR